MDPKTLQIYLSIAGLLSVGAWFIVSLAFRFLLMKDIKEAIKELKKDALDPVNQDIDRLQEEQVNIKIDVEGLKRDVENLRR